MDEIVIVSSDEEVEGRQKNQTAKQTTLDKWATKNYSSSSQKVNIIPETNQVPVPPPQKRTLETPATPDPKKPCTSENRGNLRDEKLTPGTTGIGASTNKKPAEPVKVPATSDPKKVCTCEIHGNLGNEKSTSGTTGIASTNKKPAEPAKALATPQSKKLCTLEIRGILRNGKSTPRTSGIVSTSKKPAEPAKVSATAQLKNLCTSVIRGISRNEQLTSRTSGIASNKKPAEPVKVPPILQSKNLCHHHAIRGITRNLLLASKTSDIGKTPTQNEDVRKKTEEQRPKASTNGKDVSIKAENSKSTQTSSSLGSDIEFNLSFSSDADIPEKFGKPTKQHEATSSIASKTILEGSSKKDNSTQTEIPEKKSNKLLKKNSKKKKKHAKKESKKKTNKNSNVVSVGPVKQSAGPTKHTEKLILKETLKEQKSTQTEPEISEINVTCDLNKKSKKISESESSETESDSSESESSESGSSESETSESEKSTSSNETQNATENIADNSDTESESANETGELDISNQIECLGQTHNILIIQKRNYPGKDGEPRRLQIKEEESTIKLILTPVPKKNIPKKVVTFAADQTKDKSGKTTETPGPSNKEVIADKNKTKNKSFKTTGSQILLNKVAVDESQIKDKSGKTTGIPGPSNKEVTVDENQTKDKSDKTGSPIPADKEVIVDGNQTKDKSDKTTGIPGPLNKEVTVDENQTKDKSDKTGSPVPADKEVIADENQTKDKSDKTTGIPGPLNKEVTVDENQTKDKSDKTGSPVPADKEVIADENQTKGDSSDKTTSINPMLNLTAEQKSQIEENRQKALSIRRRKRKQLLFQLSRNSIKYRTKVSKVKNKFRTAASGPALPIFNLTSDVVPSFSSILNCYKYPELKRKHHVATNNKFFSILIEDFLAAEKKFHIPLRYEHNNTYFQYVNIVGTVVGLYTNITEKIQLIVEDTTGRVTCIIEPKRQFYRRLIYKRLKCLRKRRQQPRYKPKLKKAGLLSIIEKTPGHFQKIRKLKEKKGDDDLFNACGYIMLCKTEPYLLNEYPTKADLALNKEIIGKYVSLTGKAYDWTEERVVYTWNLKFITMDEFFVRVDQLMNQKVVPI